MRTTTTPTSAPRGRPPVAEPYLRAEATRSGGRGFVLAELEGVRPCGRRELERVAARLVQDGVLVREAERVSKEHRRYRYRAAG